MARRQRDNRALEFGVLLLASELTSAGFDKVPPVTLLTIVGQALLYIGVIDVPWSKKDACISGVKVWNQKQFKPIFLSVIEHADDMHLYYNMISFLLKGRTLETKYGTGNFAILLTLLSILTSVIYVGLAVLLSNITKDSSYMSQCAIGFSGVIFALKLITTLENPEGYSYVQGFRVPTRYTAWAELIAIHLLVPNASFIGHLAGILAGLIYMKTFVGSIIDFYLTLMTGKEMRHSNSSNTYESEIPNNNFFTNSYSSSDSYGFRNRQPNYGWRF